MSFGRQSKPSTMDFECPACGRPIRHRVRGALSKLQREAYDIIVRYFDEHGVAPTLQELADARGCSSISSSFDMLKVLERKGWVVRGERRAARALYLIDPVER